MGDANDAAGQARTGIAAGLAAIVVGVGMHDQRFADHIRRSAVAQTDAGQNHVQMHHAFGVCTQIVHIAQMMRAAAGTPVQRTTRVEMRAGAAGIGRAAIAAFVHMESGHTARPQAADGASEADTL